jgi:hypothetical protein
MKKNIFTKKKKLIFLIFYSFIFKIVLFYLYSFFIK